MEITPGIHRIETPLGDRVMYQHLLLTGDTVVLIDSGVRDTPEAVIVPYLRHLGRGPEAVAEVIITHADPDHCGGNAAVKRLAPQAQLLCHPADRDLIEDPDRMIIERQSEFEPDGIGYPPHVKQALRSMMGPPLPVNGTLVGGETLRMDDDRPAHVYHAPGHTAGHLIVFEPSSRTAVITDALLGKGVLDAEGRVLFPPPYRLTAAYLDSIALVERLAPEYLLTSHFPLMEGEEVTSFLRDSREFVERVDGAIVDTLRDNKARTLRELLEEVNSRIVEWGPEGKTDLVYSLMGGLEYLESMGRARRVDIAGRRGWMAV